MTILIVDKNKDNAAAYARAMPASYDVHIYTDGSLAADRLNDLRPDALIIDLALLLSISLPYSPKVIIAMTYYLSDSVMRQAAAAGVHELIRLPCSLEYLRRIISEL